jgi:hypothetical protein
MEWLDAVRLASEDNFDKLSIFPGINGSSSFIQRSDLLLSDRSTGRPALRDRLELENPWWRFIVLPGWRGRTPRGGYCSPRSRRR